jgi:hypothetical protein
MHLMQRHLHEWCSPARVHAPVPGYEVQFSPAQDSALPVIMSLASSILYIELPPRGANAQGHGLGFDANARGVSVGDNVAYAGGGLPYNRSHKSFPPKRPSSAGAPPMVADVRMV